jgi:DNA-directed RNA polymerase subunit RPC12/RpoP
MWLVCTSRCGSRLFRALDAELVVDAAGDYQEHRMLQPSYLCLSCGAPAVDLGAVPDAIAEDEEAKEAAAMAVDVLCPMCETRVSVLPGEECPNCGTALEAS